MDIEGNVLISERGIILFGKCYAAGKIPLQKSYHLLVAFTFA